VLPERRGQASADQSQAGLTTVDKS
jgi:hypothetical protein